MDVESFFNSGCACRDHKQAKKENASLSRAAWDSDRSGGVVAELAPPGWRCCFVTRRSGCVVLLVVFMVATWCAAGGV